MPSALCCKQTHLEHDVASHCITSVGFSHLMIWQLRSCIQVLLWCEYGIDHISIFNVPVF